MILSEEQQKHRREFLDRLQRELSFGEEQSEELWDYFFVENPLIFSEQCVNAFIGKLLDSVDCGDRTDRALSLWDSLLRKYPRMSRKKKMRAFLDLLPNITVDMKEGILARRYANNLKRLTKLPEAEDEDGEGGEGEA